MKLILTLLMSAGLLITALADGDRTFDVDEIQTDSGRLEITFIGHGSLMFRTGERVVHVDPFSGMADYADLPRADLILITHHHRDHLDEKAISAVRTGQTRIVAPEMVAEKIAVSDVMKNGESRTVLGLSIKAVPAYNIHHMREGGGPYHPKGEGNGYVVQLAGLRVYIAGDTEPIPEMRELEGIDVAFLPMNLPYTMTCEMVAEAARTIKPRILYPYHFGKTRTGRLLKLMADDKDIDIRIRDLYPKR